MLLHKKVLHLKSMALLKGAPKVEGHSFCAQLVLVGLLSILYRSHLHIVSHGGLLKDLDSGLLPIVFSVSSLCT